MITLLPYPNFRVSAWVLSDKMLREQIENMRQVQGAVQGYIVGWETHPSMVMWRDHVLALMLLRDCQLREWSLRGHTQTLPTMLTRTVSSPIYEPPGYRLPAWVGNFEYHASVRAYLMLRDPEWYSQWKWTEDPSNEIKWPV